MPEAYLGLTTVMPVPAPRAAMCGRASLHLKIDVWKTILSFWEDPFLGANCQFSGVGMIPSTPGAFSFKSAMKNTMAGFQSIQNLGCKPCPQEEFTDVCYMSNITSRGNQTFAQDQTPERGNPGGPVAIAFVSGALCTANV